MCVCACMFVYVYVCVCVHACGFGYIKLNVPIRHQGRDVESRQLDIQVCNSGDRGELDFTFGTLLSISVVAALGDGAIYCHLD